MGTNCEVRGQQTVKHSAVRMSTQALPIKYTFSLFTETFLTTPSYYKDYGSLIISPSLLESPWKGRPQASAGVGEMEGQTGMGRWDSPQCGPFGAAQPAGDDLQLWQVRTGHCWKFQKVFGSTGQGLVLLGRNLPRGISRGACDAMSWEHNSSVLRPLPGFCA